MSKDCLKCARYQQIKGWRVAREAYSILWPILINNKAATLELDEKQIQGLLDVTERFFLSICGVHAIYILQHQDMQQVGNMV